MRLVPFTSRIHRSQDESNMPGVFSSRGDLDRLFDRVMRSPLMGMDELIGPMAGSWMPSVDISESENAIVLRAEVAGIDPDQINITISGDRLILSGKKEEQHEEKDEHFYHCERRFGAFERSIDLPATADSEKISAGCTNGVLTIHIPKHETAKPKRVPIESKSDGTSTKQVSVSESGDQ